MRLFTVRTPDGTPLETLGIGSHTVNVGIRRQLQSIGAGFFAVDITDEEHASVTLSWSGSEDREAEPVASLAVQLSQLAPGVVHELVLLPHS